MKAPFSVPREIASRQAIAADPRNSVWVSANAGSGKTHVLSRRVIRLLLRGTDPSKILCLTYTRAAAANMARRVYDDLAGWTVRPDADLAAEIEKLEGQRPGPERLRRARRLFAEALETPGGLKIQTIHAFCEAILHQFPLEANIAGHFDMLDQQMERSLIAEASRAMITGAAVSENPELAAAFASILDRSGESGLEALLGEIVARRDGLRLFVAQLERQQGQFPSLFAGSASILAKRPIRSPPRRGRCRGSTAIISTNSTGLPKMSMHERSSKRSCLTPGEPSPKPIRSAGWRFWPTLSSLSRASRMPQNPSSRRSASASGPARSLRFRHRRDYRRRRPAGAVSHAGGNVGGAGGGRLADRPL